MLAPPVLPGGGVGVPPPVGPLGPELEAPELEAPELDAPELEAPELDAPLLDALGPLPA